MGRAYFFADENFIAGNMMMLASIYPIIASVPYYIAHGEHEDF